jgi:hypothetical protein
MKNSKKRNPEDFKKYKIENNRVGNWTIKRISDNEEILMIYRYPSIKYSFFNKMVNDDNVTYSYGTTLKVKRASTEYALERLLAGLTPFAIINEEFFELYLSNIDKIDDSLFSVNILESSMQEYSTLFIAKKGEMGYLFDFIALKQDYQECGINVNVEKYQHLDIYSFYELMHTDEIDEDVKTSLCLIDLLMGVPIENTISKLVECKLDDLLISTKYFDNEVIETSSIEDYKQKKHGIIIKNVNKFEYKFIYYYGVLLNSYSYPKVDYTFSNKMVNDDNQYFWEDWPIEGMDLTNDVLFYRVMNGLIPMCYITNETQEKIESYIQKLDLNRFSYSYSISYLEESKEPYCFLEIAHKGKLGELFDLKSLEDDYYRSGIIINTELYTDKTIEEISLSWDIEWDTPCDIWLSGLLYGCPVENIISDYYEYNEDYCDFE